MYTIIQITRTRQAQALFFVSLFLIIAAIVWYVRASGTSVAIEPEAHELVGSARAFQQSSASGGVAVRFGMYKTLGAAVTSTQLADTDLVRVLTNYHYTTLTPIYEMKFSVIEPAQNQFDFGGGDQIVTFATAHNMNVHGHTLIWHNSLPAWLSAQSWTKSQLHDIMTNHITAILNHYKGSNVHSWDVVNEALNDDGSMRADLWLNTLGPSYLDQAYQLARQLDPAIKLYYNDYNIEPINAKSNALFDMVSNMKRRGVPIDGIGFQMHKSISSNLTTTEFAANLKRFTDLGLDVAISEMDVSVGTNQPTAVQIAAQTAFYKNIAAVCSANPRCTRFGTWGLSDKYAQIKLPNGFGDAALPFDGNFVPKPAIEAIEDVF